MDGAPPADSGAPPADSGVLPADSGAPPADSGALPADTATVRDIGPAIDTVPDMPAATGCTLAASSDMIADFEGGTLGHQQGLRPGGAVVSPG